MKNIIELKNVSKTYKEAEVVSRVSMDIKQGQIYGFLGPNGAGKTTIMKMILNLVNPSMDTIKVFGKPVETNSYQYLKNIGSIIENPVFYNHLTAYQNLKLHCDYLGYYDYSKISEMLDLVELNGVGNKTIHEFSLGMKQRLGIARAMLMKPELLILDEPINGLDPVGIKQMRELFLKLKNEYGTTIMISSHIINEIEQIADVVGVINNGVLVKEVEMDTLHKESVQYMNIQVDDLQQAMAILDTEFPGINMKAISDDRIRVYDDQITKDQISRKLILSGINIYEMSVEADSLEDYFLKIINGGIN